MRVDGQIAGTWTINEIIRKHPGTVTIFQRVGIDACCRGALALGEATRRHGLDTEALLDELRSAAA